MKQINSISVATFRVVHKDKPNTSLHIGCLGISMRDGIIHVDTGTAIEKFPIDTLEEFDISVDTKVLRAYLARGAGV